MLAVEDFNLTVHDQEFIAVSYTHLIKLNFLDGRFGLSGQVERVSVGVIDGAGLLEDLHGACELRGIIGARGKNRLDLVVVALIREGVYGDKRP